jgi:hypothetical protein
VDNPAAQSIRFFLSHFVRAKTTTIQRRNALLLSRSFIRGDPPKSVAIFFLNCTKNAELTSVPFARTVSFALAKKNGSRSSPHKPVGDGIQQYQAVQIRTRGSAT